MSSHWNIQINIQSVEEPENLKDTSGYPVKVAGREVLSERKVTEVLKLAVAAATEEEAYAKAHRMLTANAPEHNPSIGQVKPTYPPGARSAE